MIMRTIGRIAIVAAIILGLGAPRAGWAQPTDEAVENAKTAQDHEAIAQSYDAEAKALREKATFHQNQAKRYGGPSYSKAHHASGSMDSHCKKLASSYEAAAKDADAMAAAHRDMAKGQ
jgi:hypothetical protein